MRELCLVKRLMVLNRLQKCIRSFDVLHVWCTRIYFRMLPIAKLNSLILCEQIIFTTDAMLLFAMAIHCVKIVQIRSFFWSVFSCIRTVYGDLRSKSEKVPYLDTFHAVLVFASRKVVSGEASCVTSTTTGRKQTKVKTIIFGDSIPKGIRYRESNQMLKNGLAQFKIFPGIASLP